MSRPFLFACILLLCSIAVSAQEASKESALASSFRDPQLKWGPCPEFIGKGCEIALLHGDPSKPGADIFFRVPANFKIPLHVHSSAERMVLVSGRLQVTYEGQKTTILQTGMYAYGPAKLPHSAYCEKGAPCVLFIAFDTAIDAIPSEP